MKTFTSIESFCESPEAHKICHKRQRMKYKRVTRNGIILEKKLTLNQKIARIKMELGPIEKEEKYCVVFGIEKVINDNEIGMYTESGIQVHVRKIFIPR